jgi:hypothetical protein
MPTDPPDSWFNPPVVIDTATGHITRIPSDNQSDYRSMGWISDGHCDRPQNRPARDVVEVSARVAVKVALENRLNIC